jgi:hypothetical protein
MMKSIIAIIGSSEFIDRVYSVAHHISNIEIMPYIYKEPQDAVNIVKNMKPCDVVFFSGALPYYFTKAEREQLHIPSLYLAQDEMAVTSSFLTILYHRKISLERISIDLIDTAIVSNVLSAIDIDVLPIHMLDYKKMLDQDHFNLDQIVTFHRTLWEKGEIDLAITSVHAVYNQLQHHGVPVFRMIDPKTSLIRCLQAAKDQAEYMKRKSAQVAVAYITFKESKDKSYEHIYHFANQMNGDIQKLDESSFVLYSSRGDTESLIDQGLLPLFFSKFQDGAAVGFGYGMTLKEANQNALIAVHFAEKDVEERCCYILTETKELLGPFPQESKPFRLITDQPELFHIAKKTKLSPTNLSKIIEFHKSRRSAQFTSVDLAEYLQVTRRSTERIIKKLADHGYIKIVGEEMTYRQGRPRAVYELNLPM